MSTVLIALGLLVYFIGLLMLIAVAWREHPLWGFGVFITPIVALIFVARYWDASRRAFFVQLAAIAIAILGLVIHDPRETKAPESTQARTEASAVAPPVAIPVATYTPPPPPPPAQMTTQAPEPQMPMIEQVYADNATSLYYSAKCKRRPENTYRIAKSVAVRQGFAEAPCP